MVVFEYEAALLPQEGDGTEKRKKGNTRFGFGGTLTANSIYTVRDYCHRMMVIPGTYSLRIRNVKENHWVPFAPVEVPQPEAG